MDIIIRKIEENDYPAVTALLVNELWGNKISGINIVPFFNEVKNDDSYINFVVLLDNEAVGFISAATFLSAGVVGRFIYIQQIVVKNEYRSKGIGTKILKYIEDHAIANGMNGIGLCSGFQRTDAHRFYERNGFSKQTQWFGKNITP